MTPREILKQLKDLGNEKRRAHNKKSGAGDNQFGVKLGDIRKLAKKIKKDHALALDLWDSENIDARLLAILIFDLKKLTAEDLDQMVRSISFVEVADWFNSYVVKDHSDKESLRQSWLNDKDPMAARAGWNSTASRVAKSPDGLDLSHLLDRIEAEMAAADPLVQWTMNFCLAAIGIHFKKHRKRALSIGENLGVFRDYPTPKGCTSPFAPIWINEMVKRQG